jgi:hypothetical protein
MVEPRRWGDATLASPDILDEPRRISGLEAPLDLGARGVRASERARWRGRGAGAGGEEESEEES